MRSRHLNILVVILYLLAALSLLGVGKAQKQLRELAEREQQLQPVEASAEAMAKQLTAAAEQDAQNKLVLWQLISLGLFGAASLLMVFRPQLLRKKQ